MRTITGSPAIIVVIPAYQAAGQIKSVLEGLPSFVEWIIVVDDGSIDGTGSQVAAVHDSRIKYIRHERNQGVGAAMVTGFRAALELRPDVVVKVDADGQMDLFYLAALAKPLLEGRADYAKGNRLMHRSDLGQMPPIRLFGNIALSFMTKISSGYWKVFDPQNGYLAISGELLARLNLRRLAKDYFFENSMLIEVGILNGRVAEVYTPPHYGNEVSNIRIGRILASFPGRMLRGLWRRLIVKHVLRDLSPVAIFLGASMPFLCVGIYYLIVIFLRMHRTAAATPVGTIMLALVPLICSYILFVQAIVLDILLGPESFLVTYSQREIADLAEKLDRARSAAIINDR